MENEQWTRREMLAFTGALGLTALGLAVPGAGQALAKKSGGSNYSKKVLAKHPVAYWRLGEAKGPTAADATGHHHTGKYHGKISFHQKGALKNDPNTAVKLPGKAYVEVPSNKGFSQPTSGKGLTVEVWMRPDKLVFPGQTKDPYVHWLGKGVKGHFEWGFRF